ncbi:MAG: phosphopantetheine-binding protein [Actinomycetota bacterium]
MATTEQIHAALDAGLKDVVGIDFTPELLDLNSEESGVDSLDLIEVVMVMEQELDVTTNQNDFDGVENLRQVVTVFERLTNA